MRGSGVSCYGVLVLWCLQLCLLQASEKEMPKNNRQNSLRDWPLLRKLWACDLTTYHGLSNWEFVIRAYCVVILSHWASQACHMLLQPLPQFVRFILQPFFIHNKKRKAAFKKKRKKQTTNHVQTDKNPRDKLNKPKKAGEIHQRESIIATNHFVLLL